MGKTRIIAETGAGQHGVAVATVCARFGLPCEIFMGAVDVERQKPNVFRMKLLGAKVNAVTSGAQTLKDAMNEALRDWVTNVRDTYYIIGTAAGPHPYPAMVRDFQSVIGSEVREQMHGGGGPPARHAGRLHRRRLQRHRPVPSRSSTTRAWRSTASRRAATASTCRTAIAPRITGGRPGVLHGNRTYLLQDDDGQILEGHSISAGLDYPGVGPEHSWLKETRPRHLRRRHRQGGARRLPALHPRSRASSRRWSRRTRWPTSTKLAPTLPKDNLLVMNMCGRGDKDIFAVAEHLGMKM